MILSDSLATGTCAVTIEIHCGILHMFNDFAMTIFTKFNSRDIALLRSAANKEIFLDVKNPKLYKKVKKYYESVGHVFHDDNEEENYSIVEENLHKDFQSHDEAA